MTGTAKTRVAHCGTGATGAEALKGILNHPDLELVAVWVTSPDKVGRDVGELVGVAPCGILAVGSLPEALSLEPDVLSYCGTGLGREAEAAQEMSLALRAGVNVATIALLNLLYPAAAPLPLRALLEEAANAGGASFLSTGLDPGFSTDILPLALLTLCDEVQHVRIQEIGVYDHYDVESVLRGVMGFGHSPDFAAPLTTGGGFLAYWGGMVHQLADRLGLSLTDVVQTDDVYVHDRDIDTSVGVMEAGTVVARRIACEGRIGERTVITAEHVTRMTHGLAPAWPDFDGVGESNYRVEVQGNPNLRCDLDLGKSGDVWGSVSGTAMRLVNALQSVVAADPGLLSALDLPLRPTANFVVG
jgi:hypothetical protein